MPDAGTLKFEDDDNQESQPPRSIFTVINTGNNRKTVLEGINDPSESTVNSPLTSSNTRRCDAAVSIQRWFRSWKQLRVARRLLCILKILDVELVGEFALVSKHVRKEASRLLEKDPIGILWGSIIAVMDASKLYDTALLRENEIRRSMIEELKATDTLWAEADDEKVLHFSESCPHLRRRFILPVEVFRDKVLFEVTKTFESAIEYLKKYASLSKEQKEEMTEEIINALQFDVWMEQEEFLRVWFDENPKESKYSKKISCGSFFTLSFSTLINAAFEILHEKEEVASSFDISEKLSEIKIPFEKLEKHIKETLVPYRHDASQSESVPKGNAESDLEETTVPSTPRELNDLRKCSDSLTCSTHNIDVFPFDNEAEASEAALLTGEDDDDFFDSVDYLDQKLSTMRKRREGEVKNKLKKYLNITTEEDHSAAKDSECFADLDPLQDDLLLLGYNPKNSHFSASLVKSDGEESRDAPSSEVAPSDPHGLAFETCVICELSGEIQERKVNEPRPTSADDLELKMNYCDGCQRPVHLYCAFPSENDTSKTSCVGTFCCIQCRRSRVK